MRAYDSLSDDEKAAIAEKNARLGQQAIDDHMAKIAKVERRAYTSLDETQWGITFDTLPISNVNRAVMDRIKNWHPGLSKGVVLLGTVGTGKSSTCKALINRFASPKYRCMFISVTDALKAIRKGMDNNHETSVDLECSKLVAPNLLVFDDLGVDNATEWGREQIFSIFEARLNTGKHTWFTTNLSGEQIRDKYGERIHDRMLQGCSWVKMEWESFRKMNFKNEI